MKILIIGDTHAEDDIFLRILAKERGFDADTFPQDDSSLQDPKKERGFDVLLHTGDFEGSELVYRELCGTPFYYVAGNNDFFTEAPFERVIELESCRIYMTHGHQIGRASCRERVFSRV